MEALLKRVSTRTRFAYTARSISLSPQALDLSLEGLVFLQTSCDMSICTIAFLGVQIVV